jgi:hypothetical protein
LEDHDGDSRSILQYLSFEDAQYRALQTLERVKIQLQQVMEGHAAPLLLIADELEEKIKSLKPLGNA